MHQSPSVEASEIRRWAARAWLEMESAGVLPTPQNFALWFRHISGGSPEVSHRDHLIQRLPVTPAPLLALHASFASPKTDLDEIVDRAGESASSQT